MSDPPMSRQEIYAAAAAHNQLGPEYSDAVVASFLEKVDKEIDARINERLAGVRQPAPPAERDNLGRLLKGAAIGVGVSGIVFFAAGGHVDHPRRLIVVLLLLVVAAVAGWAGRRMGIRRSAQPPARPPGRVTN